MKGIFTRVNNSTAPCLRNPEVNLTLPLLKSAGGGGAEMLFIPWNSLGAGVRNSATLKTFGKKMQICASIIFFRFSSFFYFCKFVIYFSYVQQICTPCNYLLLNVVA